MEITVEKANEYTNNKLVVIKIEDANLKVQSEPMPRGEAIALLTGLTEDVVRMWDMKEL